jgi:hypothetical protein
MGRGRAWPDGQGPVPRGSRAWPDGQDPVSTADGRSRMARAQYPGRRAWLIGQDPITGRTGLARPDGRMARIQYPRPPCRQKRQPGRDSPEWTVNCPESKPYPGGRAWYGGHGQLPGADGRGWMARASIHAVGLHYISLLINKELVGAWPDGHVPMTRGGQPWPDGQGPVSRRTALQDGQGPVTGAVVPPCAGRDSLE